jgi:uracil-DNA glycosylase
VVGSVVTLNNAWDGLLHDEFQKDYYQDLRQFLKNEYRTKTIYPDMHNIFNAFKYTDYRDVKVVIVGQDPYINPGEAHGLAFSVQPKANIPPSLQNIFKELETDSFCYMPNNGCLIPWAEQGVMLLNASLTVERGKSRSHAGRGWETFTDAVMELLDQRDAPTVFMLWGKDAQIKGSRIVNPLHLVLVAAHPSPLAGGRFFGCKHFSQANEFLKINGQAPIDWQIPNV